MTVMKTTLLKWLPGSWSYRTAFYYAVLKLEFI